MITTKQQFALLYPSIPDALFRRLMMDETLAFLRQNNTIYGFRVTTDDDPLPGLVQIAVSKQHILAYVTPKEVILFPSVEVLGDSAYQFDTVSNRFVYFSKERFTLIRWNIINNVNSWIHSRTVLQFPHV